MGRIKRTIEGKLLELSTQFPALALLGPRQSGKTTLVRALFPDHIYIDFESFEEREFAQTDPRGFLRHYRQAHGVIFDEIQKVPQLFSYIQLEIDEFQETGRFVLIGSQNLLLNEQITQSLAGRVALTTLLPLSIEELRLASQLPKESMQALFQGFYPRVYDASLDPVVFAESYIRTYIERDVRAMKNITSLSVFQKFMRLCAGRVGQLLNLTSLANEVGVTLATIKGWLSILEATYEIFLLQPYFQNVNKRVVKTPKLYFYDTALACSLLKITDPQALYYHDLRGGLFESMIVSNLLKNRFHAALPPNAYFWRDKAGSEVDCLLESGEGIEAIEIKAGETANSAHLQQLLKWNARNGNLAHELKVVYAGERSQQRKQGTFLSWSEL